MEEKTVHTPCADVRVMTLKRWNFPQTSCLFSGEKEGPVAPGDYISYNSHHFIHIEKCPQMAEQPIPCVYHSLEELRREQRDSKDAQIHMVQSLTLLGEECDFWDTAGDVLFISFLQLTNDATISVEDIRKKLAGIISARAPGGAWVLYQSLDFCDLVLFTKGLSYEACNEIMWDLAIVRGQDFSVLRDSFTIYGFRYEFLKKALQEPNQTHLPPWMNCVCVSVQLGIQSYTLWKQFEDGLKEKGIIYQLFQTFGRYDARLAASNLSAEQFFSLLRLLDTISGQSKGKAFGCYEIALESPGSYTPRVKPQDAHQDSKLEQAAGDAMDVLCGLSIKAFPAAADYVDETQRSLKALLKNGFSEEFVLSVLTSFLNFLRITIYARDYSDRIPLEPENAYSLRASQEKMTRHYFNALNIAALCTMHGERQFVQAPAFNACYFDVPPKLMAFYSAVAWEIQNALKSPEDADYQFLFVPNYQQDINVRPLELDVQENPDCHLAVVYLWESYFYDPVFTIKLFCHEAAHYLSDRRREVRAKHVFRVVSFSVLVNTRLGYIAEQQEQQTPGHSVLAVMADALADFLMDQFREQMECPVRGIPYHLCDISRFLKNNQYGMEFFRDSVYLTQIIPIWKKSLYENVIQDPEGFGKNFCEYLPILQESLHSNYLETLFQEGPEEMYVYEVFARLIAHDASFPNESVSQTEFGNLCENMIQSFSEAYADLRMAEMIGSIFSWKDYDAMFAQVDVANETQKNLRHDSVLKVMAPHEGWKARTPRDEYYLVFSYAADQIRQYLEICHDSSIQSDRVEQILKDLQEGNASQQCSCIRKTICQYRTYLTQYCQEIQQKYSAHP